MRFTTGNLLDADVEALVNTVNTVGVMGKGIALMFRDQFPENARLYGETCKAGRLQPGGLFVTERSDMLGPRWIVNFATKKHWRHPSKVEWVVSGLRELRSFIEANGVRSVAIPPLGAGNGGLDWTVVRSLIERELNGLTSTEVVVFEPAATYQNVSKRAGVEALTPARALVADMVRRYEVLGIDCTMLEAQKLAWFVARSVRKLGLADPLKLSFAPHVYGPYADGLRFVLDKMDGSYLQSDKRVTDSKPLDVIRFKAAKRDQVAAYFTTDEAKPYRPALEAAADVIDGFESPLGMELLATVDWLRVQGTEASLPAMQAAIRTWPGGFGSAERKARIFEPRLIELALDRLVTADLPAG